MQKGPVVTRDAAAVGMRRVSPAWAFGAAAVAAAGLLAYLSLYGGRYGLDLNVYRDAVDYWRSGRNPYPASFTEHHLAFTYPPFAFLVLSPLSWPSFVVAQWLLWVASIAAAAGSVVLILRERGLELTPRVWCLAIAWSCAAGVLLEPARSALDYGQIEFILMFAIMADILVIPRRYRGILIGVAAAVKLTPLIFIVLLLVGKDWKSTLRSAVSFAACSAISWAFWPSLSQVFWSHAVSNPARVGTIAYSGNQSWYAILHRPPFPSGGSTIAWLLLSAITLAIAVFVAWHYMRENRTLFALLSVALAGLLISPISWTHHWIWVILIPPMLAVRQKADQSRPVRLMLWGLVVLVIAAPYWWFSGGSLADATSAVLPLWAAAALVALATAAYLRGRNGSRPLTPRAAAAVPVAAVDSGVSVEMVGSGAERVDSGAE